MNPNSALSPNAVKTALDLIFMQEFNGELAPNYAGAETPSVFKQSSTDRAAVVTEVYMGSGLWELKPEENDVPQGTFKSANTQTFLVSEFARSIDVPRTFQADAQFDLVSKAVEDMGRKGRMTRDSNAMAIYRNAFAGGVGFNTNDGVSLVNTAHPLLGGGTQSNLLTAVLSETSLNDAIVAMAEMKSQDGVIAGCTPKVLLVPPKLFKLATEITQSKLRSGTGNNDANVYSDIYGIEVRQSRYLGAAAGGSDVRWFLLGDNHSVTRWAREDIWTEVVDWKYQRNNNYIYKGGFREVVGAIDYVGVVGSNGTV
jgi:hypothetical protein